MKSRFRCVAYATIAIVIGAMVYVGCGQSDKCCTSCVAADKSAKAGAPQRFGSVIGLKPEKAEEYIKLHAETWPEILKRIKDSNIRNYSIYMGKLDDGNLYLFSYFEYIGDDYEGDMKKIADDPKTKEWWKLTDPCQIPQKERKEGEHWMQMQEVFHTN